MQVKEEGWKPKPTRERYCQQAWKPTLQEMAGDGVCRLEAHLARKGWGWGLKAESPPYKKWLGMGFAGWKPTLQGRAGDGV
jgi:hypothetical protein